jgi:sporulation protein YlmC with PRC-barrel domain
MTSIDNPVDTHGRMIAASKVNGTAVYNTAGENLGSIYDVMLDKASGKVDYAILSFGGFLGEVQDDDTRRRLRTDTDEGR